MRVGKKEEKRPQKLIKQNKTKQNKNKRTTKKKLTKHNKGDDKEEKQKKKKHVRQLDIKFVLDSYKIYHGLRGRLNLALYLFEFFISSTLCCFGSVWCCWWCSVLFGGNLGGFSGILNVFGVFFWCWRDSYMREKMVSF